MVSKTDYIIEWIRFQNHIIFLLDQVYDLNVGYKTSAVFMNRH